MKITLSSLSLAAFVAAVAPLSAASYTWDASGGTPLNDGGGTWNATGGTNWFDGTSYGAWGNSCPPRSARCLLNSAILNIPAKPRPFLPLAHTPGRFPWAQRPDPVHPSNEVAELRHPSSPWYSERLQKNVDASKSIG